MLVATNLILFEFAKCMYEVDRMTHTDKVQILTILHESFIYLSSTEKGKRIRVKIQRGAKAETEAKTEGVFQMPLHNKIREIKSF